MNLAIRFSHLLTTLSLATLLSSQVTADNVIVDNLLQPTRLEPLQSGWVIGLKAGFNEGSGEISSDMLRLEAPRITGQINAADKILFTASIPYLWIPEKDGKKNTLGDPTFLTTVQTTKNQSFTIAVTEPAANRPFEPDVVRFMAFYTAGFELGATYTALQFGTEIPDRFGQEGQDDILSFGLKVANQNETLALHAIKKQVVDGQWWDLTQPLENPLNRTNLTINWVFDNPLDPTQSFQLFGGIQQAQELQVILGLNLSL